MSIPSPAGPSESRTVHRLRVGLLAIFLIGALGSVTELLLLGHTEDTWQWVPLVAIAVGLVSLGWWLLSPSPKSLRTVQAAMVVCIASGVAGLLLHYRGNVEFELEMYPSLKGLPLFWEAMRGATPALAPGTMIQLGLLGLAYAYRHPAGAAVKTSHAEGTIT